MKTRNPFREPTLRNAFETMLAAARDPSSELYHRGTGAPRTGALHRCAFWDGFAGRDRRAHAGLDGTISFACYRAGQAWKKERDAAAPVPPVVFSPKFVQAFGRTWNAIGYDALEIAGDDNAAAVELVLDADRLLTFGDDTEAYAEYRELLRVHGYRAVHRAAVKRFSLV